jgi:LacI family transcriptional regulator
LLEHGYGEAALFSGLEGLTSVAERTAGWSRALREFGIEPGTQRVYTSDFDRYGALEVARGMFAEGVPRAIFAQTDEQAIGILFAASQLKLRVPEDVAVVSFDDIREAAIVTPGLTTVSQSIAEKGARAVDAVLGERASAAAELLPTRLIIRGSCGCVH